MPGRGERPGSPVQRLFFRDPLFAVPFRAPPLVVVPFFVLPADAAAAFRARARRTAVAAVTAAAARAAPPAVAAAARITRRSAFFAEILRVAFVVEDFLDVERRLVLPPALRDPREVARPFFAAAVRLELLRVDVLFLVPRALEVPRERPVVADFVPVDRFFAADFVAVERFFAAVRFAVDLREAVDLRLLPADDFFDVPFLAAALRVPPPVVDLRVEFFFEEARFVELLLRVPPDDAELFFELPPFEAEVPEDDRFEDADLREAALRVPPPELEELRRVPPEERPLLSTNFEKRLSPSSE